MNRHAAFYRTWDIIEIPMQMNSSVYINIFSLIIKAQMDGLLPSVTWDRLQPTHDPGLNMKMDNHEATPLILVSQLQGHQL